MANGSENKKTSSGTESDDRESDSVYDFLYYDAQRIGAFYAQFSGLGDWLESKRANTVSKGTKRGWKLAVGGGMADVATGEASVERGPGEAGTKSSERAYDPLWIKGQILLDYLTERDLINASIKTASIGQFILIEGNLIVLDVAMLKSAWSKETIKKHMIAGAKKANTDQAIQALQKARGADLGSGQQNISKSDVKRLEQQIHAKTSGEVNFMLEMLSVLPHAVQAFLLGDHFSAWGSLREDALVGQSSDLVLKHGSLVSGRWHVLSVLDAMPDLGPEDGDPGKLSHLDQLVVGVVPTMVGKLAATLSPVTRQIMGRPHSAYGITPILIFRRVG